MSSPNPEELEKLIHRTLRSLPDRPAPRSLESRVLAAIAARQSLPWWHQSFTHWPVAARGAFLVLSGALAATLIILVIRAGAETTTSTLFSGPMALLGQLKAGANGILNFGSLIFRSIPSWWIYGGLTFMAFMYATLIGLGATAYRTFFNNR
jgi:hypothetical protein|uniref:hypothetical protein n=2 Tax=Cephaloticoccus sp. TaxID=1985742 RepID=UPI004049E62F